MKVYVAETCIKAGEEVVVTSNNRLVKWSQYMDPDNWEVFMTNVSRKSLPALRLAAKLLKPEGLEVCDRSNKDGLPGDGSVLVAGLRKEGCSLDLSEFWAAACWFEKLSDEGWALNEEGVIPHDADSIEIMFYDKVSEDYVNYHSLFTIPYEPNKLRTVVAWRRKRRTIKIGDVEVAAPEREELKRGQPYFFVHVPSWAAVKDTWSDHLVDKTRLSSRIVFLREEDCKAAANALRRLMTGADDCC